MTFENNQTFLFFAGIIIGLTTGIVISFFLKKYRLWHFKKSQNKLKKRWQG